MTTARPQLPPEFIAAHKRRRMIDAMAELCAEQGYEATKIADVVRRAHVARKTLYDNFSGKEELFLAAFDATLADADATVAEACATLDPTEWEARTEAGQLRTHPGLWRDRGSIDGFFAARFVRT